MISPGIKSAINSSITPGCGAFLKWKDNSLYKVHEHWRHLDPEDGLLVLLGNFLLSDFHKLPHFRNSNRSGREYVVYITTKLK
jgi:hypothetical protein